MSSEDSDPERDVDLDEAAQRRNAFAFILAKLGRRDHTEKELKTALARKAYAEEVIEAAIAKARGEGLVNDERLAGTVARMTARSGKRGPRRIVAALRQKGISAETAQAVTKDAFEDSDEAEANLVRFTGRLLQKARGDTLREKRVRVLRSLLTRGFELSEARRVLRIAENAGIAENTPNDADQ